jgi:hypothetical protein
LVLRNILVSTGSSTCPFPVVQYQPPFYPSPCLRPEKVCFLTQGTLRYPRAADSPAEMTRTEQSGTRFDTYQRVSAAGQSRLWISSRAGASYRHQLYLGIYRRPREEAVDIGKEESLRNNASYRVYTLFFWDKGLSGCALGIDLKPLLLATTYKKIRRGLGEQYETPVIGLFSTIRCSLYIVEQFLGRPTRT